MFLLLKGLLKAGPVSVIGILLIVHLILIFGLEYDAKFINKIISQITQILGGVAILHSIRSTFTIFGNKSLFTAIADHLKALLRRPQIITPDPAFSTAGTSKSELKSSFTRNPETIEENIEYLQEQIDRMEQELEQETKEINERIDQQLKEMREQKQKLESISQSIDSMASKINRLFLGKDAIKSQLYGVSLVFYGAISGFFA